MTDEPSKEGNGGMSQRGVSSREFLASRNRTNSPAFHISHDIDDQEYQIVMYSTYIYNAQINLKGPAHSKN